MSATNAGDVSIDLGRRLVEVLAVAACDRHPSALAGERRRDPAPDPAAAADHQRDPSLDPEVHPADASDPRGREVGWPPMPEEDLYEQLIAAADAIYGGPRDGVRALHAKGAWCEGTFTASPEAGELSRAFHLLGRARSRP